MNISIEQAKAFNKEFRKRVSDYFRSNNISRKGNWVLYIKAILGIGSFVTCMVLYYLHIGNQYLILSCAGVCMAFIGMNTMHDGAHGSFSKYEWVNKITAGTIYVLAGNVTNWDAQHNVKHHYYTNIYKKDDDLDSGRGLIRFSRFQKKRWYHALQFIYALFLYTLLTLNWAIRTDFTQTLRYSKDPLVKDKYANKLKIWTIIIVSKLVLFCIYIYIPVLLGYSWVSALFGFIVMHLVAGFILSHVFEMAHINAEVSTYDKDYVIPRHMQKIHQIQTTQDFAVNNPIVNFFTGGLNKQTVHHLEPNTSHVHYTAIQKILEEVAEKFNIQYHKKKYFMSALFGHYKYLYNNGIH